MNLERYYIRQFLNESQNQTKKFEQDNNLLYAYTTKDRSMDGGWATASSIEELRDNWNEAYGSFRTSRVLVMKPATSVDKAMVLSEEPNTGGDVIYPSIDAAINGPTGLIELGWEEDGSPADVTEDEIQELLQTKDLKRAEEILRRTFVDAQDYGYFDGLYEYVSGPMPKADGQTPGKIIVPTELKAKRAIKDLDYYKRKFQGMHVYSLGEVPEKFRTQEVCELAVKNFGKNLQYVPDELIAPELCKVAVEEDGCAIKYVPDNLITQKLCNIAFKNRTYAFTVIPDKFKTPEMCRSALAIAMGDYFEYVPDRLKTPEMCKAVIEKDGYALEFVPDELKTPELCQLAVDNDDYAIRFVPDEIKKQIGGNTDDKEQQ